MEISQLNSVSNLKAKSTDKKQQKDVSQTDSGIQQFSSKASNASYAYGRAAISFGGVSKVADKNETEQPQAKTLNFFYLSDTHGELSGLTKVGAAQKACEEFCGGPDNLTVLGAGDLIAGSQKPVIDATVGVVNEMGMQATAMGNHERSRSDGNLLELANKLAPEMLAINSSDSEKANCQIASSMVLTQNGQDFIVVGAKPLTPIQHAEDIATAIDAEVAAIKADREAKGLSTDLPVVFLSHMGSAADKTVAENSETVNLILGGHTHNVEDNDYVSKDGRSVKVLQGGKNNAYATTVQMTINPDGTISSQAKKIDLKQDVEGMCSEIQGFYVGKEDCAEAAKQAASQAEEKISDTISESVGPKVDVAYVPEGQGYINDGRERYYSNPVSNIMADAMLSATQEYGAQVSFFNAPSLKDTEIPDMQNISNYDIMSRMLPFGGDVVVADVPVSKFYEIIEKNAQSIITYDGSQLIQCGGMTYSVDAEKAKARYDASIGIMQAEDDLKKAKASEAGVEQAEAALEKAKAEYDALPGCVGKILILNQDGTEIKINPKAIARGDFDGQTIKCATNDFLAHKTGIDTEECGFIQTGKELTKVFEEGLAEVKKENDDVMHVDHNDVRIAIKDKDGLINGYALDTGLNTKYWY